MQTGKHSNRQTCKQADIQNMQTGKHANIGADRQTCKQANMQTGRHSDMQTCKKANIAVMVNRREKRKKAPNHTQQKRKKPHGSAGVLLLGRMHKTKKRERKRPTTPSKEERSLMAVLVRCCWAAVLDVCTCACLYCECTLAQHCTAVL